MGEGRPPPELTPLTTPLIRVVVLLLSAHVVPPPLLLPEESSDNICASPPSLALSFALTLLPPKVFYFFPCIYLDLVASNFAVVRWNLLTTQQREALPDITHDNFAFYENHELLKVRHSETYGRPDLRTVPNPASPRNRSGPSSRSTRWS